jgi:hypothetical protein
MLWSFGIVYGHLGNFMTIWYIFPGIGIMHQEKSGNPYVEVDFPNVDRERRARGSRRRALAACSSTWTSSARKHPPLKMEKQHGCQMVYFKNQ